MNKNNVRSLKKNKKKHCLLIKHDSFMVFGTLWDQWTQEIEITWTVSLRNIWVFLFTKRDSFLVPGRLMNTFDDRGGRGSGPWDSSQSKTFGSCFEPEM